MKQKRYFFYAITVFIMILVIGILTNYADTARVTTGKEPQFCVKMVSSNGSKVTYLGLGYKVIRYVGVSPTEPFENNIGVKMGNWFMKYELPEEKIMQVEYDAKTVEITDQNEINKVQNILVNSKYDSELCKGSATYQITLEDETYYVKEDCMEIQKEDKQAKITQEDLDIILQIIEGAKNRS